MKEEDGSKWLMAGKAKIQICASRKSLGVAAALRAANLIQRAIAKRGHARVMVATGNSQLDLIDVSTGEQDIDCPISPSCPASVVRRHPNAHVYLDKDSASLLSLSLDGSRMLA